MIDAHGRTVKKKQKGGLDIYVVGGLTLSFPKGWPESMAMDTINAHAPEGYVSPPPSQDRDLQRLEEMQNEIAEIKERLSR